MLVYQEAAKTQAIENIFKEPKKVLEKNTKQLTNELGERQRLAEELHNQYKKPKQLRKKFLQFLSIFCFCILFSSLK